MHSPGLLPLDSIATPWACPPDFRSSESAPLPLDECAPEVLLGSEGVMCLAPQSKIPRALIATQSVCMLVMQL